VGAPCAAATPPPPQRRTAAGPASHGARPPAPRPRAHRQL
jgi:hypothetical protein